jgi:aspartyl-tRNA(Asn)/glutamyl-tRNA(Gln) amidotransferase subunit C
MSLSADEVRWVAQLARLELSDADVPVMASQLGAILDYVRQLQDLDTDAVEPLAHPLDIRDVFRADEPAPSLRVAQALQNAPARNGDFYSVPAVLD